MLYIVLDDDETWSTEAYVVPEEILTDEQKGRIEECDSKVFKNDSVPCIYIETMVQMLKDAGLWRGVLAEMQARAKGDSDADKT
jgi:hypothetical protein